MFKWLQALSVRTKIMVPLGLVIILALGGTFYWMALRQEAQITQQVEARARALFENAVLTRAWVAAQGGVYIKKQGDVETNPYLLQIPNLLVDFHSQDGTSYTLRNPALVTRELSELGAKRGENFAFHITSLNPLNPGNAPTPWEAQALRSFDQGERSASSIDADTYRYMAPLLVTEACIPCHKTQGYQVGDIRGGISVSIPFANAQAAIAETRQQLLLAGVGTTVVVLLIVYAVVDVLVIKPLQAVETTAREISRGQLEQRVSLNTGDELGSLAHSFNEMTTQLQNSLQSTEQQVTARTRQLEIAAHLAERFSAILDLDRLLSEVVNRIKEAFNYYHAHIYLLDEPGKNLLMAEGAGKAGAEMKAAGHSIPLAAIQSLVARAARSGQIVSVDNVRQAEDWLPNPLLPDTYSEMAVPIKYGTEVMGVLDVQQNKIAGLDEADASLLRSLAGQVAVAVNNARLFLEIETSLAESRTAQERYTEQAWETVKAAQKAGHYLYAQPTASTLAGTVRAEAKQQAFTRNRAAVVTLNAGQAGQSAEESQPVEAIVSPVTVNNKTVGTFRLYRSAGEEAGPQPWTESDLSIVEAVIDQLAQTAENLRLFEETRTRAGREQLVAQISDKLRRAQDFESLMKVGVEELSRALGPARTFVQFGSEDELLAAEKPAPASRPDALPPDNDAAAQISVLPANGTAKKPLSTNRQGDKQL